MPMETYARQIMPPLQMAPQPQMQLMPNNFQQAAMQYVPYAYCDLRQRLF